MTQKEQVKATKLIGTCSQFLSLYNCIVTQSTQRQKCYNTSNNLTKKNKKDNTDIILFLPVRSMKNML